MKKQYIGPVLVILIVAALAGIGVRGKIAAGSQEATQDASKQATSTLTIINPVSHAQSVYIEALEWCESRGNTDAINKVDRDGTPSYYSWQWKPATFAHYAIKYGVLPKGAPADQVNRAMHNYTLELKVVEEMVLDAKNINWRQEFPDCTKKIGYPPAVQL